MGANYQYYDDGRMRFVDDLREDRFDRYYEYDHVGRVTKSVTGYLARQAPYPGDNSQNGPYNHYYGYDEFDHLTSRTGNYWYRDAGESYTATYVNNRNQRYGWNYDADGRPTRSETTGSAPYPVYTTTYINDYVYDAAGQRVDNGNKFDGDGRRVRPAEGDRYYMLSTVLGGRALTEIYSELGQSYYEPASRGRKARTFVYINGEPEAEQAVTFVTNVPYENTSFKRRDPAGTSAYAPGRYGSYTHQALDIQGIATEAPNYAQLAQDQQYYQQRYSSYNYGAYGAGYNSTSYGGGMPGNFGTGCAIDGMAVSCSQAVSGLNNGSLSFDPRHYYNGVHGPTLQLPINSQISVFGSPNPYGSERAATYLAFYVGPVNAYSAPNYQGPYKPPDPNGPCQVEWYQDDRKYKIANDPKGREFTGADLNYAIRALFGESSSYFQGGGMDPDNIEDERDAVASVFFNHMNELGLSTFKSLLDVKGRYRAITGDDDKETQKFNNSAPDKYQSLGWRKINSKGKGYSGDCNDLMGAANAISRLVRNGPRYDFTRFRAKKKPNPTTLGHQVTVIGNQRFGYRGDFPE